VTSGIDTIDFLGCSINYTGAAFELAWIMINWKDAENNIHIENKTVMVGMEGPQEGKMIVTGSNFPLDNWGIHDMHKSNLNSKLTVQAVICRLLHCCSLKKRRYLLTCCPSGIHKKPGLYILGSSKY